MRDLVVAGLLISPFVKFLLLGGLIFVPVRATLVHLNLHKWVWHPILAEASIYICIVAALNIILV
jgi:hypothetical protein